MSLNNVAHEHLIQAGKKVKQALVNFMESEGRGPRIDIFH